MNVALILAGGHGSRTEQDIPKQFMNIYEKPLIIYTLENFESHPDIDGQIAAIRERDLRRAAELMGNVLETVTIPAYPVIGKIKEKMMAYGALGAMMSGSGPTVFGLFEDEEKARYAYEKMRRGSLAKQVYLTRIMNHGGDANDR